MKKNNPVEARVSYNIGRVASLTAESYETEADADKQGDKLREAKAAYEDVINIYNAQAVEARKGLTVKDPVDAALVSRSFVALAKIYEFYDNKEYAIQLYDAALRLEPVVGDARGEALAAKARLIKTP